MHAMTMWDQRIVVVGCGARGVRFRPRLNVGADEPAFGLEALRRLLKRR